MLDVRSEKIGGQWGATRLDLRGSWEKRFGFEGEGEDGLLGLVLLPCSNGFTHFAGGFAAHRFEEGLMDGHIGCECYGHLGPRYGLQRDPVSTEEVESEEQGEQPEGA